MKIADYLAGSDKTPVNPLTGEAAARPAARPTVAGAAGREAASRPAAPGDAPAESPRPAAAVPEAEPRRTSSAAPASALPSDIESLAGHLRAVIDSKVVAAVVLGALLVAVVGLGNLIVLLACYLLLYMLLDRFVTVRRCISIGGTAWLCVLVAGGLLVGSLGRLPITVDYLFMFCGFLLAIAVCGAFFAGRAMYYVGYDHGREEADAAIAAHVVDRLVERPDEWGGLDGDYLEVESALNRVRERERSITQALRDEARRKDDLVTYLAHDLKTPLASVVGYLSLLEEAPDLPAEQRARFTGIALEKAHRLDTLIEEFFDITRFDFHDIVLTRSYIDLSLLLAQVADEFYPTLTAQGKTARIDAQPGLTLLVDGDKMARVFNNVMKNAIAYSYEGSEILVGAARREDGSVRVRFENQGDPIPAPKLKLIFEKFYRLDAARATNRGGAGLGLAIAREIVSAHGGTIACESTPEHTVFTIDLPAA